MDVESTDGVSSWMIDELAAEVVRALQDGSAGDARMIDGRVLAVKASPAKSNSQKVVMGMAALPAGYATHQHSHEAEEVAIVVSGSGIIEIGQSAHRVSKGSVLITPSNAPHVTRSDPGDEALVILWLYAPPGSESRWLQAPVAATS